MKAQTNNCEFFPAFVVVCFSPGVIYIGLYFSSQYIKKNNNLGPAKPSLHTENSSAHLSKSTVIMSVIILRQVFGNFSEALEKWSAHLPSSYSISLLIEALFEVDSGPC